MQGVWQTMGKTVVVTVAVVQVAVVAVVATVIAMERAVRLSPVVNVDAGFASLRKEHRGDHPTSYFPQPAGDGDVVEQRCYLCWQVHSKTSVPVLDSASARQ